MKRTGSIHSRVGPAVTTILSPSRSLPRLARAAAILASRSGLGYFPTPSSTTGGTTTTPLSSRREITRLYWGVLIMFSCMAGATATGLPDPIMLIAVRLTGLSPIP